MRWEEADQVKLHLLVNISASRGETRGDALLGQPLNEWHSISRQTNNYSRGPNSLHPIKKSRVHLDMTTAAVIAPGEWLLKSQLVPGNGVTEVGHPSSSSSPSAFPALKRASAYSLLGEQGRVFEKLRAQAAF